jgi:hypothetical protein
MIKIRDERCQIDKINKQIQSSLIYSKGKVSDGYHTFSELYDFRLAYNALLFNEWAANKVEMPIWGNFTQETIFPKYDVHKSLKHNDGELCFGGGWFIVMAETPYGQISNHYELKYWSYFKIPEKEVANKWEQEDITLDILFKLIGSDKV